MGAKGPNVKRNGLVFLVGVIIALIAGWAVFPRALYVSRQQPLDFFHKTHAEKSGLTTCDSCHAVGSDGQFAGMPKNEVCTVCHADMMGTSESEALLVDNYLKQGEQPPWLIYSQQPANVWFSHAIHIKRGGLNCADCHGHYGETDQLKTYEQNRISGYSRDIWGHSMSRLRRAPGDGMKMTDCENCHGRHHVEAGCLGCHQ